ncbi:uncharacterized protein LOC134184894 [Corticium candelabrum]|uniref:uncharacterized protein LOC134184894 n=1 Tax=Corticium candelabrum TaxID=121492 RepID=UPI002E3294E3|nr:uncharacterized protein LOC134184894 [Corticium candelabrum]
MQNEVQDNKTLKIAIIIVKIVMLVCSLVGIAIKVNKALATKAANQITGTVRTSKVLKMAVSQLKKAFTAGSNSDKVEAIVNLIKALFTEGLLLIIIRELFYNMSVWEKATTVAKLAAMSIVIFGSGGLVFGAKIVLLVSDGYDLVKDVREL